MASTITDIYEQPQVSMCKQPGLSVSTKVYRGDYKQLQSAAIAQLVGCPPKGGSSLPDFSDLEGNISVVQLVRTKGEMADLTVSAINREEVEIWNLDYMEIQKNIRSWHADQEGEKKPDLSQLSAWESLKDNIATRAYYDKYYYQVPTGSGSPPELTGATKTLAQMIREEGIESFSVYTPVITKISMLVKEPESLGSIGKTERPSSSGTVIGSLTVATLAELADSWLKTVDRLQSSLDGSLQRTEQWVGADKWNENLYEKKNSSS